MTTVLDVQGRRTILYVTNKSGGSVALGDVVIGDSANDEAFTTTTTAGYIASWVGVVIEANGIANNVAGRVCVQGYISTITCNASVTRGNFIKTHTVAKQGTSAGASRVAGVFAEALTTSATPSAVLFGMPDGSTGSAGSAGTPALTLSTTNSAGSAVTLVATDATIAAFDATSPSTQALGDAAAVGTAGTAARRDHKHAITTPTLTEATLAGDVTLTTAGTFYDGPTITPASGIYDAIGFLACLHTSALSGRWVGRMLNGSTVVDEREIVFGETNVTSSTMIIPLSARVTMDGATALKLTVSSLNRNSCTLNRDPSSSSSSVHRATLLSIRKVG